MVKPGFVWVATLGAACEATVYYPRSLDAPPGWVSACDGAVDATVDVENQGDQPVLVHELLPDEGCAPSDRGVVPPGERAALGPAEGRIWRIYGERDHEWLGTFALTDGENLLVVP